MKKVLLAGIIFSTMSSLAMAEDVKTWGATAELGGTMTTGNTETSTLKAKIDAKHTLMNWNNNYYADVLYSKDGDNDTASRWQIGAKGAYVLDESSSLFILGEYEQDKFSSYDAVSSVAAGYSHSFFKTEKDSLSVDIGPGMKHFKLMDGGSEDTGIVHLGLVYENALSATSKFTQIFVSDVAFDSEKATLSRSETAITANIFGELAMKVGVTIRHDNQAAFDKKSVDTETTVTLLYTF
ncbi:MAG: DUF481 domain-containing protein [Psychrobium sp.]|nr:DUF481 domain-containing protein [Psychrobium sp.]